LPFLPQMAGSDGIRASPVPSSKLDRMTRVVRIWWNWLRVSVAPVGPPRYSTGLVSAGPVHSSRPRRRHEDDLARWPSLCRATSSAMESFVNAGSGVDISAHFAPNRSVVSWQRIPMRRAILRTNRTDTRSRRRARSTFLTLSAKRRNFG